jgi:hypothetical protein
MLGLSLGLSLWTYFFGRLLPYFDRLFVRPSTPDASSVPRRM